MTGPADGLFGVTGQVALDQEGEGLENELDQIAYIGLGAGGGEAEAKVVGGRVEVAHRVERHFSVAPSLSVLVPNWEDVHHAVLAQYLFAIVLAHDADAFVVVARTGHRPVQKCGRRFARRVDDWGLE